MPHAVLDIATRKLKAKKIETLLNVQKDQSYSLLEVGTGSGGIAHYFANFANKKFNVKAVDVIDNRLVSEGFDFQLVSGVSLPFPDESFDIVLTNHVIEHVGSQDEQIAHLKELARVLKKTGVGYLAVPNRWMLVEPHYKLIFLSWLPRTIRTPYLRLMGKGSFYDCEPLEKNKIESFFSGSCLSYENRCVEALKLTCFLERPNRILSRFFIVIPDFLYKPFVWLIPTLIYTFNKLDE